jgi:hypothetical protein
MLLPHPTIQGLIKRRILVNYRVQPEAMAAYLPAPFRPQLYQGWAIAGICLIRLENIRPKGLPAALGLNSENAAHRVAVTWDTATGQAQNGVYIPRRDTDSCLNHWAGGRLFPGEHQLADFTVNDHDERLDLTIVAHDHGMRVHVRGEVSNALPANSCFSSLAAASHFFECGGIGYSATGNAGCYDGLRLNISSWQVTPLTVSAVASSFFDDTAIFPAGTAVFDHALLMRGVAHSWHPEPPLRCPVAKS